MCLVSPFVLLRGIRAAETEAAQPEAAQGQGAEAASAAKETQPAQVEKEAVEVNADMIEYQAASSEIKAKGNVVAIYKNTVLTCDNLMVNRMTNDCIADGNVTITDKSTDSVIKSSVVIYNFDSMMGTMLSARIKSDFMFGKGQEIQRASENHFIVDNGYMTSCSFDQPHYRVTADKVDFYPKDRMRLQKIRMKVGERTLMYMPRYLHWLDDKRPRVTVTPGMSKDWGIFVLSAWRYYVNENIKGRFHLDYRERKDLAWGPDLNYGDTPFGKGNLSTYYMRERSIATKRIVRPDKKNYAEKRKTKESERFRVQWRHKWEVDDNTNLLFEYHKLSDANIIKDYIYREYEKDSNPQTYFLGTRSMTNGTLSFLIKSRVNRFQSMTEQLPEITFQSTEHKIGSTPLLFNNRSTFSSLNSKDAAPSDVDYTVNRLDEFNRFSMPSKVAFLEFKPFVSSQQTYYSRTRDDEEDISPRTVFSAGGDLSTKFFRIFEVNTNAFGLDINRLRHVITPTASYAYTHDPTISSEKLRSFDGIDSIAGGNSISIGLTNKLQTKRGEKNKEKSVDLATIEVSSSYDYHPSTGAGSKFSDFLFDLEVIPYSWLRFEADTTFDHISDEFENANLDLYAKVSKYTSFGIGHRYQRKGSKELTTQFTHRINPKWKFSVYERYQFSSTHTKEFAEQEYVLTRDLHCGELDITYNVTRNKGEALWFIYRLKAFPEMEFEYNKEYHQPKPGS